MAAQPMRRGDNLIARWMSISEGTVVSYARQSLIGVVEELIGPDTYGQRARVRWRAADGEWMVRGTYVEITTLLPCEVEEQRDEVWASYCAWRLSQ